MVTRVTLIIIIKKKKSGCAPPSKVVRSGVRSTLDPFGVAYRPPQTLEFATHHPLPPLGLAVLARGGHPTPK
jgi:hypothetical protein